MTFTDLATIAKTAIMETAMMAKIQGIRTYQGEGGGGGIGWQLMTVNL